MDREDSVTSVPSVPAPLSDSEKRHRETERRLNAVLDNASVAIFLMDEHQHCAYMNAAAERMTGFSLAETVGRALHDVIHHTRPDGSHYPLEECPIDRAFPQNNNVQGEEVFVHRDGHFYPVAFTASPIRDEASQTIGTIIEVRDISSEKAAEAQLRASQRAAEDAAARNLAILSQLEEGVIVTHADGRIAFVNEAASRIHGVAALDVPPDRYSGTYHLLTEDGEPYPPADLPLARAVRGEAVREAAWRIRRPDGSEVLARGSARPLLSAGGAQVGAVLTLRDDTQRDAAEREVRENEARLRALTDNLPGGMVYQIATGLDGSDRRFLYVSQSHEKLTGYTAEEVLADPTIPYRMIHPDDGMSLMEAEARAIAQQTPFDAQARFFRKDGEMRWCRIISAPRPQPGGGLIWDGIQIDITDHKRAEAALRESEEHLRSLNDTLEERVRQRTAELERVHEQLRQSQKLEAMGQLTGGVAHDFNNLLTPIIGSLDMLQRRAALSDRDQRLIGGALESAERARTLVQRLLAFARRQPLQVGAVDVAGLIEGMADLVASTSGPQIKVAIDIAPDLPCARSDPNQLEMALLNLSVNARDAMPDGGKLTISAVAETIGDGHRAGVAPGAYVRLSVSDTGIGMDEATRARAIEPFFSTKGVGKGTGLGLSMVHGLTSQLGGAMLISSRPRLGTTVDLFLPAVAEEGRRAASRPTRPSSGAGAGKVLLVDDEELVRASTAEMLADLGFEVVQAASAGDALACLAAEPFDHVVTDHLMPGMTGTELARTIADIYPQTPVLVISGYAAIEGVAADIPRLAKPFRQDELARSLAHLRGPGR